MFLTKFSQVEVGAAGFTANKNQVMPFIGEVLAGTYTGTIIDGTMFEREGLVAGKLYACQNYTEEWTNPETGEVSVQTRVQVIDAVSLMDFAALAKQCGPAVNKIVKSVVETGASAPKTPLRV